MAATAGSGPGSNGGLGGAYGDDRPSGHRRQKMMGYLRAANELRQTYQQSISNRWQEGEYEEGMPGAFPDADITRSGDEEMLLFPSYARKHTKATHPSQEAHRNTPGTRQDVSDPDARDEDYWRREWQKYEDANAVVDVDVRGWIYSPQKGPLNRRNRIVLAVARRMSGIPAPDSSPSTSRDSSRTPGGFRDRVQEDLLSQEEEAAAREADLITRHGQREAEAASKGSYSADNSSLLDVSPPHSRPSSPSRARQKIEAEAPDNASITSQKRQSWNMTNMSRDEILAANEQLMSRLRPFMTLPLANTPITIFFFNENKSQSKSVYTDDSGHFKVRAALDFVPKQVRVLASEKLSATEDVVVTDSKGVSMVSDIDDTIKHSAIAMGAKEIFKNTFVRELGDLTVAGVKEWYTKMASMGVKMHYVSNSPWQLYPLLRSYFSLAGLPPGSFHLKQYSGMLQGIFEPAAERKKGSLDRIMHDFPERKFLLVGDSGEADLEVYTDIVQEHPDRVLGVFIRDVTSKTETQLKDFFNGSGPGSSHRRGLSRTNSQQSLTHKAPDQTSKSERGPKLPDRPQPPVSKNDDLIDFSEDATPQQRPSSTFSTDIQELEQNDQSPPQRPTKPDKPSNLRSMSTMSPPETKAKPASNTSSSRMTPRTDTDFMKPIPPPPAPRRTGTNTSIASTATSSTNSTLSSSNERFYARNKDSVPDPAVTRPPPPQQAPSQRTLWDDSSFQRQSMRNPNEEGYLASARHHISNAYNAIPPLRSRPSDSSLNSVSSTGDSQPPLPPRRGLSSYPAAAARSVFNAATGAAGGDPASGGDGGAPGQPYDKKLEMWKRRWVRADEILKRHGVVLRTWRHGADVADECERLVKEAMEKMKSSK